VNDAISLAIDALSTLAYVAGPLLVAALATGVGVGIVQTVTQVNEQSISFLAKLITIAMVLVLAGGTMSSHLTGYARRCFGSIEKVVR
jgi:flagellar biosynthetic protein FliQ